MTTRDGRVTLEDLFAAGWDVRQEEGPEGYLCIAKDTGGAGMCYLSPPHGFHGERWREAWFCNWVFPWWLTLPGDFDTLSRVVRP